MDNKKLKTTAAAIGPLYYIVEIVLDNFQKNTLKKIEILKEAVTDIDQETQL